MTETFCEFFFSFRKTTVHGSVVFRLSRWQVVIARTLDLQKPSGFLWHFGFCLKSNFSQRVPPYFSMSHFPNHRYQGSGFPSLGFSALGHLFLFCFQISVFFSVFISIKASSDEAMVSFVYFGTERYEMFLKHILSTLMSLPRFES